MRAHEPASCPACRIIAALEQHRDNTATNWSLRRGMLNFAIVIARRECPIGGVS
jgi:hypothetical protein